MSTNEKPTHQIGTNQGPSVERQRSNTNFYKVDIVCTTYVDGDKRDDFSRFTWQISPFETKFDTMCAKREIFYAV